MQIEDQLTVDEFAYLHIPTGGVTNTESQAGI